MNSVKRMSPDAMKYILVTDVGSTTTKARLFSNREGEWRYLSSGESPTTVEAPYENVTLGVKNAVNEVEELIDRSILSIKENGIMISHNESAGVDLYCTTSSAGGGLQMMVAGVIKTITAESANRAALGAGAIVMDILAVDDQRKDYEKIRRIRNLRPDMILLAGGTDGGTQYHVIQMAELIKAAGPKPRLGVNYKLPMIYAGNKDIRTKIEELMGEDFALEIVENLRSTLETEQTEPARIAVHELFMEHVMSHAPGYNELMTWTDIDIMPTPAGEGLAIQLISRTYELNVIGVGLGGATTNIYSIVDGKFVRSVSANLGMSYSITNVMKEAGIENIMRWIPFHIQEKDLGNRLLNKMIRPTTIPQTLEELIIEHSVAREAIRLGFKHHKTIATRLKGIHVQRDIASIFDQGLAETYIDLMNIDIIVGTGGLLSHAPRRAQSMLIMIDAYQPEGITMMFQDSVFMMPHLGVLSSVYPDIAWNIFDKDCLIRLGTVIAPKGIGKEGDKVMNIDLQMSDGKNIHEEMSFGEIKQLSLKVGQAAKATISPQKGFDIGAGPGKKIEREVQGGVVGLLLDARGRPLQLPNDTVTRRNLLLNWFKNLDLYPSDKLRTLTDLQGDDE